MDGERIIEALDLADNERAVWKEYEETKTRLSAETAAAFPEPQRNPVLAAYNLEPETYVLSVIEKVPSTSLTDALLVLPFSKVLSLLIYLGIWAEQVRFNGDAWLLSYSD